ncbi:elongation factor G [Nitrospinae bacterium AH_259_B05_G02_I21]|nr:elongation factor G [Nitrospinae bacterium AH_259_B05_G02_I21]MDA2931748.1 elongation factor G [Nitrospinae bacterium AH-259-F20]
MTKFSVDQVRNVGLVGHGGVGKTSLAEAMLFAMKATDRLGRVDAGNTVMDYDEDEVERQMSLAASLGHGTWGKHKINLVDTPGAASFFAETEGSMRVMDGVVVVLSATAGIEVQTEKAWSIADRYGIPRCIFVNKMDQEGADFIKVLEQVRSAFAQTVVPLYLALMEGERLAGLVDLLTLKALRPSNGKLNVEDLPEDALPQAEEWRDKLIEAVAEVDDALLERYLEGETLSEEELLRALRTGVTGGSVVPVLCGVATDQVGVAPLLDCIVHSLPSPSDRGAVIGNLPASEEEVRRKPLPEEPLAALVFKTMADPYAGRLTLFRVYSGTMDSDGTYYNASKDARERVGQLYTLQGKQLIAVKQLVAGDFGVVAKLKVTATNDTLSDEKAPILLPPITFPEPAISFAIIPKAKGDEEKISSVLARMMEEDLTLRVSRDPQTGELVVSGRGQVHVEVTMARMKSKFGVQVDLKPPRVPYRETIRSASKAQGRYKKQTGGRGQYGDIWIEIEPLPRGEGFEFVNKIVGGAIPRQYIPAVEKGISEAMESGPLAGYPMVDLRVRLYDGTYHDVDSSEMAFKIAGSLGFKKGSTECNPVLLEPVMTIEVIVSEEFMGDIIGDLNARRGRVLGVDSLGALNKIRAHAPLAEVLTYASALDSMTGGRGDFSMEFSDYEEVPAHLSERIIADAQKGQDA